MYGNMRSEKRNLFALLQTRAIPHKLYFEMGVEWTFHLPALSRDATFLYGY